MSILLVRFVLYCCMLVPLFTEIAEGILGSAVQEYLKSHLSSYDLIESNKLISKRSIGMETKTVKLVAFNRTFSLVLIPEKSEALDSNISISVMDSTLDEKSRLNYSSEILTGFYTGVVDGDPKSKVRGYFTANQLLCSIYFGNGEVLSIEPLAKFTENASETQLLAYYDSQLKDSVPGACETNENSSKAKNYSSNGRQQFISRSNNISATTSSRSIRSAEYERYTCSIKVVVDHLFYDRIGISHIGSTMRTIVKIIDDVNEVFFTTKMPHPTDAGKTLPSIGFKLASLFVFTKPDKSPDSLNAALVPKKAYSAAKLLKQFSKIERKFADLYSHCLNHLFTYRPMQRNVLGLARVGTPCLYGNIGLTSHSQSSGLPLLFRQAVLVTAHEFGHNMGSMHDPLGDLKCSPDPAHGGKFLMHEKAVQGFHKNNERFSPCSISAMAEVIEQAMKYCLIKTGPVMCGNYRLDPGEECDAGISGDHCCHGNCKFKPGAVCSDANWPCCSNCKVASKGTICLPESPLRPCRGPSRCTGSRVDCPSPSPLAPDGSVCNSGIGKCLTGVCVSACYPNLECACPEPQHSCLLCCRRENGADQSCYPLELHGGRVNLPVDWPCRWQGTGEFRRRCTDKGTCSMSLSTGAGDIVRGVTGDSEDKPSGKTGVRLMRLSVSYSVSSFASNNIVFITITVTLFIYVPLCLILQYRDKLATQASNEDVPDEAVISDVTHEKA
uniref:Peptidase M12B domain-containing protein n=1 Tax=Macrostomum lignano TaxID=282301 RepID=A0A1I8HUI9_9PLAT